MAKQTITGKAFEYSLLQEFYSRLKTSCNKVVIIENTPFFNARDCYNSFSENEKGLYSLFSSAAINFMLDLEPRLSNSINDDDTLQLEIVSDSKGQSGDVRDVLAIRLLQKWEIGISAKNNHKAVKHSRLSPNIDFGKKWLGLKCSRQYFNNINPIFNYLSELKSENPRAKWSNIPDMHKSIYVPLLDAFKEEIERLDNEYPNIVPQKLAEYLIGTKDFYKVIKGNKGLEIQAYNLHGTLNLPFEDVKPKHKFPKLKLPSRLIEIAYEENSDTTLIVSLNEGWQISFRIHSAKSTIEPSLKFDINLISTPSSLFTQHTFIGEK